jgi:hypothetical protein
MKWKLALAGIVVAGVLTLLPDRAEAQYGGVVRRTTRRRTAVVVGTSVHAADEAAAAKEQAETPKQAAPPPAAPPPPPPVGAVVSSLPSGCTEKTVSGTAYHQCGQTWYRAAFEGNQLVYVTTAPPG